MCFATCKMHPSCRPDIRAGTCSSQIVRYARARRTSDKVLQKLGAGEHNVGAHALAFFFSQSTSPPNVLSPLQSSIPGTSVSWRVRHRGGSPVQPPRVPQVCAHGRGVGNCNEGRDGGSDGYGWGWLKETQEQVGPQEVGEQANGARAATAAAAARRAGELGDLSFRHGKSSSFRPLKMLRAILGCGARELIPGVLSIDTEHSNHEEDRTTSSSPHVIPRVLLNPLSYSFVRTA